MALVLTFCNRMQISYELMQHLLRQEKDAMFEDCSGNIKTKGLSYI